MAVSHRIGSVRGIALAAAGLAAMLLADGSRADIGIRSVEPAVARAGGLVRLTISGFLGPRPWSKLPIVIVAERRAPKPYACRPNAICPPSLRRRSLARRPYMHVATVREWRPIGGSRTSGVATVVIRVPRVAPGRYVFGLFCAACTRGPKGSLIIDARLVLTVRAS